MKLSWRHLAGLLALILLSVAFGLGFDAAATAVEKENPPRPDAYASHVKSAADGFGVPETVLWALIKTESDFHSGSLSETGDIGLLQISPDLYAFICREVLEEEALDDGILYDPATNLRVGSAYLSWLYRRYGVWENVYVAWVLGYERTDVLLRDPACVNGLGVLDDIPERHALSFARDTGKAADMYAALYY